MNKSLLRKGVYGLVFITGLAVLAGLFIKGRIFQTGRISIEGLSGQTGPAADNEAQQIPLTGMAPITFDIGHDRGFWIAGRNKLLHVSGQGAELESIPVEQPFQALLVYNETLLFGATAGQVDRIAFHNGQWEQKKLVQLEGKPFITSLCHSEGRLYLADAGNRKLHAYSLQGSYLWSVEGREKFIVPSPYFDVVANSSGGVWIVNPGRHRVEHYDQKGRFRAFWEPEKKSRFSGCCNPAHLAVLPGDRFVTLEKGIVQCRIFSPSGSLEKLVAGNPQLANPLLLTGNKKPSGKFNYELALKKDGSIVILDADREILHVFKTAPPQSSSQREESI